jgi:selT/selW/selH-like putative selenoprotein
MQNTIAGEMIRRSVEGVRVEVRRTGVRGAFEVYLGDDLLYSRLRYKQFPNFEAVVESIRHHVQHRGAVQVGV